MRSASSILEMASGEHKELAEFLKSVHSTLRKSSTKMGAEAAWFSHCENRDVLKKYAQCMEKLATTYWAKNGASDTSEATSRIQWAAEFSYDYFLNKSFTRHRLKEVEIAQKISISLNPEESFLTPLKLLDVGSCYNPFKIYEYFDVTAIDLCPANDSVLACDFLNVAVGLDVCKSAKKLEKLPLSYYDIVTFCFLLEYIPSSELRIKACEKAYSVLKPGALLIINTPDSKHVGANSKIMKCWQYTLAIIGFTRIKYEKLKHMHCMAFRKAASKDVANRWAKLHKCPSMEYAIHIPQDFNSDCEESSQRIKTEVKLTVADFQELPFCEND